MAKKGVNNLAKIFIILTIIVFVFIIFSFKSCSKSEPSGNVAVISIKGIIIGDGAGGFGEAVASSSEIVGLIEKADKKSSIKAIVLEINSPGGSAVASKEIADALKKSKKPSVAVIREVGASGGYWIASAADHIIADDLSVTGSIGVISSYPEFSGLLEKYNITYNRLIAGQYKDIGDPFVPLSADGKSILLSKINKIHQYFIKTIAVNRGMAYNDVAVLATGEIYLGIEALDLGLIDELGNKNTAKKYLKEKHNIDVKFAEYSRQPTIFDLLMGVVSPQSYLVGQGIGDSLKTPVRSDLEIMI